MRTKLLVAKSLSLAPAQQCQPAVCRGGSRCGARAWQSGGGGGGGGAGDDSCSWTTNGKAIP